MSTRALMRQPLDVSACRVIAILRRFDELWSGAYHLSDKQQTIAMGIDGILRSGHRVDRRPAKGAQRTPHAVEPAEGAYMGDAPGVRKREYFIDEAGAKAFGAAFLRLMTEQQKQVVSSYIAPETSLVLRHHGSWAHPGAPEAISGGPHRHSATIETPFDSLIDNDLGIIRRNVQSLVDALHRQFASMIYSTVSSVCEQTGNTVDAKASGSIENALLEMIEKVELIANRRGEVALPEMHVGPDAGARMKEALANASPEFKQRFDEIVKRKTEAAQAKEAQRKARFARYGDGK